MTGQHSTGLIARTQGQWLLSAPGEAPSTKDLSLNSQAKVKARGFTFPQLRRLVSLEAYVSPLHEHRQRELRRAAGRDGPA